MLEQVTSKLTDIKNLSLKELNALGEKLMGSEVGSKVNELTAKASEVGEKASAEMERFASDALDKLLSVLPDPTSITPALKHELVTLLKEPMHIPSSAMAGARAFGEAVSGAVSDAVRHAPTSLSESLHDLKSLPQALVVRLVDEAKSRLAHKTESSQSDSSFKSGEFHDAACAAEVRSAAPTVPELGIEAAVRNSLDAMLHEAGQPSSGEHKGQKKHKNREGKESHVPPTVQAAAAGAQVAKNEE